MPSSALHSLQLALQEVGALQRANPSPSATAPFRRPDVTRAIGRAQVVLLSSHFERYIYEINEEAVEFLLHAKIQVGRIPLELRLLHSRQSTDRLVDMSWERREEALRDFSASEAKLWDDANALEVFDHARLMEWMKAPTSDRVQRYFRQWGIPDIFTSITRTQSNRGDLWLRINDLVDKRNNIAHGDLTVQATHLDISRYLGTVRKFTSRCDRRFARTLAKLANTAAPW